MAQPTPPPTTHTRFIPSVCVGLPSGPTKSWMKVALVQGAEQLGGEADLLENDRETVPFSRS
jgi:hypothetical protein